jgi:hypothetical protein
MDNQEHIPDRGLIIRQPWIGLILEGAKTWEMRSKPTEIRGRIALIEAGSGMISGEANLIDSLEPIRQDQAARCWRHHRVNDDSLLKKWCYPWVLDQVKKYEKPIPYNHPMGAVIWVNLKSNQPIVDRIEHELQHAKKDR